MSTYESAHMTRNQNARISVGSAAVAWIVGGIGSCCLTFVFPVATYCTGPIFLIGSLAAAVTGYMGRKQIQQEGGSKEDEQWATIGMILGIIGSVLAIGFLCFVVFGIASLALLGPDIGGVFSEINRELGATPIP